MSSIVIGKTKVNWNGILGSATIFPYQTLDGSLRLKISWGSNLVEFENETFSNYSFDSRYFKVVYWQDDRYKPWLVVKNEQGIVVVKVFVIEEAESR